MQKSVNAASRNTPFTPIPTILGNIRTNGIYNITYINKVNATALPFFFKV